MNKPGLRFVVQNHFWSFKAHHCCNIFLKKQVTCFKIVKRYIWSEAQSQDLRLQVYVTSFPLKAATCACLGIHCWRLSLTFVRHHLSFQILCLNQHKRKNSQYNQHQWTLRLRQWSDRQSCRLPLILTFVIFVFHTVLLSSLFNTVKQLAPYTGSYMSVFTCVSTVFWLVNSATCAMWPLLDSLEAIDQLDPFVFQPFQTLSISITLLWQKIEFPLMHFYVS